MDLQQIKQIVDLMKRSNLTEFEIEEQNFKLRICRKNGDHTILSTPVAPAIVAAPVAPVIPAAPAAPVAPAAPAPAAPVALDPAKVIKSPMVGTFYAAGSPDAPAFAQAGTVVNPESTVCIIEAMKVMNEIKAEVAGTIAEVLVKNGDSVEYGQPIFRLK